MPPRAIRSRKVSSAESITSAMRTSPIPISSSRAKRSRCETERSTRCSSSSATRAYSTFSAAVGSSSICCTRLLAAVIGLRISCAIEAESVSIERACSPDHLLALVQRVGLTCA